MAQFKGFGELKNPSDLVKKLESDFERLKKSTNNQYVAFDFFVTAEHIIDWIHPNDANARKTMRSSSPLLKIVSHIANGAKHFQATATNHKSIDDIEKQRYVEPGYVEEGYFEDSIIIKFSSTETASFGQSEIEATALAQQVLTYWQSQSLA